MTLHADALALLRGWAPPTPAQAQLKERYVAHLAAEPRAMERGCRPDHLTASTLVISADGARVLLTHHAKADAWFQFGGHCEPADLSLAGAALREATEESGISTALHLDPVPVQLSEHAVPFCGGLLPDGSPVHHLDVRFVGVAPADAAHAASEESHDVRWWPADALPVNDAALGSPDPDLVELVALAQARLRSQSASSGSSSSLAPAE